LVLSSVVSPDESLGRFLPEESYFSRKNNTVRPKAFMPTRSLKLSVFRIEGLSLIEIWGIGQREVIDVMAVKKNLYGMADIKAQKVQDVELAIELAAESTLSLRE
jgi:hypothetical protein